jgi:hypothetical protein
LYVYERELLKSELDQLAYFQRDSAIKRVVVYILSDRSISDPVNLETLSDGGSINFEKAIKVCGMLEWMEIDFSIYHTLTTLINMLVKPNPNKEHDLCVIGEKQALTIAKNLNTIVKKLPDTQNIKHDGYKVACLAYIAKLRSSSISRANDPWKAVAPSWHELADAARNIPNLADKVLVMAWVGEVMYRYDPNLSQSLLEEAGKLLYDLPAIIDKGNRLQILADSWKILKDDNTAKHLLKEAMTILHDWTWDENRDQLTGKILQQAHAIDPEFAASLTSLVDNPYIENGMEQFLAVQDLRSRPDKEIEKIDDLHELLHIRGRAAVNLLESLCSGKSDAIQTEEKIVPWVQDAFNARFKDAYFTSAWYIENSLYRTSQKSGPSLTELFKGLMDNLQLLFLAGQVLLGAEHQARDVQYINPELPEGLFLFPAGSADEAIKGLKNWIDTNVSSYLKIYDAYFRPENLKLLASIPDDTRVYILVLRKGQNGERDDRKLEQIYRQEVKSIFGKACPEIHLFIFGTKTTGDGPIHNRYYITQENRGIQIGTSTGGLGNKDSDIRIMKSEEVITIEADFVNSMIVSPPSYYHEERLAILSFTIRCE